MLTHLIIILDKNSPSFCYYKHNVKKSELLPLDILDKGINFACQYNLSVNFLLGKEPLSSDYLQTINSVNHVKLAPESAKNLYPDAILIIDEDSTLAGENKTKNQNENLILRLGREDLPEIASIFKSYNGKYQKLNMVLLDIEEYSDIDIAEYEKQLQIIKNDLVNQYKRGCVSEVNFLSDLMVLNSMNNCNAGIAHYTLAPNGNFYICPGMYYDDEPNCLGNIDTGIQIKQKRLLNLEGSPVCSKCDAYQCKRCVYLNKKITLEYNIPSRQQCVLAHLERNATKDALSELHAANLLKNPQRISAVDYLDPFLMITENAKNVMSPQIQVSFETEDLDNRQLLLRIYQMQTEILSRLQHL